MNIIETELIVLKKIPYTESSLILSGLSPSYGKVDFILRGGRKLSKKSYITADLLNIVKINFFDKSEGLIAPKSIEVIRTFDHLASNLDALSSIFKECQFIIQNKHHAMNSKLLYAVFIKYIESFATESVIPSFFIKLALFYEDGLLPELSQNNNKDNIFIKNLLIYICHHGKISSTVNEEYLTNLRLWTLSL